MRLTPCPPQEKFENALLRQGCFMGGLWNNAAHWNPGGRQA